MDTTLIEAGRLMASRQNIVITTHSLPDGDGLGAEIALYHYLKRIGKSVRVVNPDATPHRYQFLDPQGVLRVYDEKSDASLPVDLAIVVDTDDPRRLGKVWNYFQKQAKDILIFDHHPHSEQLGSEISSELRSLKVHTVVDVNSSSIGELLYRLFHVAHQFLDPDSPSFRLSPEIALGLYVSIITDTNSFRYSKTTALSHRIAADLLDYGLQPEEIYQSVYSTKSADHLRLIGEVLSRVSEVPRNGSGRTVAWVEIPKELRKRFSATSDDTQSIVNFLLLLKSAEILVLLREEDDGRIKVSLKSRGNVVVHEIAREFGGGGHEFAAGFSAIGSLAEIRSKLVERITR